MPLARFHTLCVLAAAALLLRHSITNSRTTARHANPSQARVEQPLQHVSAPLLIQNDAPQRAAPQLPLSAIASQPQLLPTSFHYNRTRVAHALYKIVKLFGVKSVCDMPASAHQPWIQPTLSRLTYEIPSFQYTAIDNNHSQLQQLAHSLQSTLDINVASHPFTNATHSHCELLFYWPPSPSQSNPFQSSLTLNSTLSIIQSAKAAHLTHIILAQRPPFPGQHTLLFRSGRWTLLHNGLSTAPFALNQHVKGAIPVANSPHRDSLYMTLYSLRSIPRSDLPKQAL